MSSVVSRRELLAGIAGCALLHAQQERPARPARPMICLFSKYLQKLHYTELGGILNSLGFDGCDLTVRKGGHVLPEQAPVDMVRAVESIRGEGVEVPMITTDIVSPVDPYARNVLGLAGQQYMKVPYFRPGYWEYNRGPVEARLAEVRRDITGLSQLARGYGIAMGIHNHAGNRVGQSVWEIRELIRDLDSRWTGYYFDPCQATMEGGVGGWNVALRLALPRIKMLAVQDFYWEKSGGKWKTRSCPMGEGMVDWPHVFGELARARFAGPLSLHIEYNPADELAAIARDLAYVKKQVETAWGGAAVPV